MGKLAKPQRSKKHKKMKAVDPFYVGDRPLDKNAYKFNQKPKHEFEQEFSRSVREIEKLKKVAKLGNNTTKTRKKKLKKTLDGDEWNEKLGVMERGVTRPYKAGPDFKKRKDETDKSFMYRVDRETAAVIQQAKFEDKYDIQTDQLDEEDTDKKKPKKPEDAEVNHKKLRLQNRKAKLADKKRQKKEDRYGGFAALKDNVQFGEVAHQPPTFTAKPRKAPDSQSSRPGTKSLLLTKMLSGQQSPVCDEDAARRYSGGRKPLSMSERAMLEAERERVVQLYRDMKSQQQQKH